MQLVSLIHDSHLRAEQSLAELAGLKTQTTTTGTGVNVDDCDWTFISSQIPGRTNKQCKERWRSCLDPALVRGPFTPREDAVILERYAAVGRRWTQIAAALPGRSADAVRGRCGALLRAHEAREEHAQLQQHEHQQHEHAQQQHAQAQAQAQGKIQVADAAYMQQALTHTRAPPERMQTQMQGIGGGGRNSVCIGGSGRSGVTSINRSFSSGSSSDSTSALLARSAARHNDSTRTRNGNRSSSSGSSSNRSSIAISSSTSTSSSSDTDEIDAFIAELAASPTSAGMRAYGEGAGAGADAGAGAPAVLMTPSIDSSLFNPSPNKRVLLPFPYSITPATNTAPRTTIIAALPPPVAAHAVPTRPLASSSDASDASFGDCAPVPAHSSWLAELAARLQLPPAALAAVRAKVAALEDELGRALSAGEAAGFSRIVHASCDTARIREQQVQREGAQQQVRHVQQHPQGVQMQEVQIQPQMQHMQMQQQPAKVASSIDTGAVAVSAGESDSNSPANAGTGGAVALRIDTQAANSGVRVTTSAPPPFPTATTSPTTTQTSTLGSPSSTPLTLTPLALLGFVTPPALPGSLPPISAASASTAALPASEHAQGDESVVREEYDAHQSCNEACSSRKRPRTDCTNMSTVMRCENQRP